MRAGLWSIQGSGFLQVPERDSLWAGLVSSVRSRRLGCRTESSVKRRECVSRRVQVFGGPPKKTQCLPGELRTELGSQTLDSEQPSWVQLGCDLRLLSNLRWFE